VESKVWRKAKYVCIALLFLVTAAEVMTFAYSVIAERKAERLTELLATLKPGYTTMDSAKELFQAHGVSVDILHNACGTPNKGDSCDDLSLSAANFRRVGVIPLQIGRLDGWLDVVVMLAPFPPVKRAAFAANLYFINGILASINTGYGVGTTGVGYTRGAGEHNYSIWSRWKDEKRDMVKSISVSSSGTNFDVTFPRFAFKYMYSVKRTDARMLWPKAPPPTEELQGGVAVVKPR
jgi:hypothetical protein